MKKKALQIQAVQEPVETQPLPTLSFSQELAQEREERRLKREQDDNEALRLLNERVKAVASKFGFTIRELWDHALGGALDFEKVQEFGGTECGEDDSLQTGSERLYLNTAGDCIIETSTYSRFVTIRESAQWSAEMFNKHFNDSSHNEIMMTEWLRRVAGEMR
jgi:hypothetical protein